MPTARVVGELDVPRAAPGLGPVRLAGRGGADVAGLSRLNATRAEELERSVRSSAVEVATGGRDRIARRLEAAVEIDRPRRGAALAPPASVGAAAAAGGPASPRAGRSSGAGAAQGRG